MILLLSVRQSLSSSLLMARVPWLNFVSLVLGVVLLVGVGLGLSFWLLRVIWRLRWGARPAVRYVHFNNVGNIPTAMRVLVVSPETKLRVNYRLDGAPLALTHEKPFANPPQVSPQPAKDQPAVGALDGRLVAAVSAPAETHSAVKPAAKANPAQAFGKAQAGMGEASGLAALLASILNTLGSLLPGELGRSAKQAASGIQRSASMAQSKVNAPIQKVKQAQRLQEQVSTLKVSAPVNGSPAAAPAVAAGEAGLPRNGAAHPSQTRSVPAAINGVSLEEAPSSLTRALAFPDYVQLPAIEPAGAQMLELRLAAASPFQGGRFPCWVLTQTAGAGDFSAATLAPEKSVQWVDIRPASRWGWFLALLCSALVVLANAAWVGVALTWLMYWWR
jgi:hypothetical protein